MTTRTRARATSRARQRGRFARQSSPAGRTTGSAGRLVPRRPPRFGRQQPKKSAARQTVDRVSGGLRRSGHKARSRSGGTGGKRTAGLAVFAGAVGAAALALKNRARLKELVGDSARPSPAQPAANVHPPTVAPGDPAPTTSS
jgi:hypothetical protein